MISKAEILQIVKEQLAIECNCLPDDFDKRENVITPPGFSDKRRKFVDKPFFFKMTTMGGNAVISADEALHEWFSEFIKNKEGHWLFEHTSLREIDDRLKEYGKKLYQTHHMYLPLQEAKPISLNIPTKWFEKDELQEFYIKGEFPNALCEAYLPERPDMLAVAAYSENKIIGLAGCSADTPLLWQIGIDVKPEYQQKGIGTYLVSILRDEIFARGKIPYYGTSLSNLYSCRIALKCGFTPAWIDVETLEL